ncbi:ATP-binding protein [Roseivirga sp. E12]|uniref:ATP-binding protein n=1 Tax=Roseivirga sp. E12 TaxID=2819237 RepID=UPI00351C6103
MKYSFDIPSSKNKLRLMRKFVTDVLKDHDVSDIEINMMVLAVDEVCANIIIHGHPSDDMSEVKLGISFKNEGVWFEIIDQGNAFDIVSYQEPVIEDLVRNKNKGGIGIMLVKKIMDDIQFKSSPSKNTLTLYKKVEYTK